MPGKRERFWTLFGRRIADLRHPCQPLMPEKQSLHEVFSVEDEQQIMGHTARILPAINSINRGMFTDNKAVLRR